MPLMETPPPVLSGWTHGARHTYVHGCRCVDCCDAERAYRRGLRHRDEWEAAPGMWLTALSLFEKMPWASAAKCRGEDPSRFFAPQHESATARRAREWDVRTRLCDRCTVIAECRAWARKHREYGFWGGESEEERAAAGFAPAMPIGTVARIAAGEMGLREVAG